MGTGQYGTWLYAGDMRISLGGVVGLQGYWRGVRGIVGVEEGRLFGGGGETLW